jgi:hypothetical protein
LKNKKGEFVNRIDLDNAIDLLLGQGPAWCFEHLEKVINNLPTETFDLEKLNNLETKTIDEGFKKFSWNSLSGCKIVPIPNYLTGQENELILHVPKNIYEKLVEEQALRQQESGGGDDEKL